MKILKLIKQKHGHYFVVFDEIPEITYEKIGADYVGSAVNSNGDIISSHFLKRQPYGNAFAGRELELKMKDDSTEKIKNHWFDHGSYKSHGEFTGIGAGTVEKLQDCYVYFGYNINKITFGKMIDEYLKHEKLYEYYEVEDWCRLQHEWYDVVVNGQKIPFTMNKKGDMVEKESKKRVFPRSNVMQEVNGKYKTYVYFKFNYKENGRLIKIDANYFDTLVNTLPHTEEEIKTNCGINRSGGE